MIVTDLNPLIFAASLFSGYVLWSILKMSSKSTTLNQFKIENMLSKWRSVRKIAKWKNSNKITDDHRDDTLSDKDLKFWGCSQAGDALYVKFSNKSGICDANFTLKLNDGTVITIPDELEHPIMPSFDSTKEIFSSKGLTLERLIPFSKWRITFNGLCYVRKPNHESEKNDDEPQHVIFTFFWTAVSDPLRWPNEWSPKLLLGALGNVEHIESHLNELLTSGRGFDQFGSLFGQVTIDNEGSKEIHEMNLPGVRMSRDMIEKSTEAGSKRWCLMASCKNGLVISMTARDIENEKKIFSGCLRMLDMSVCSIEDTNLKISDMEVEKASEELHFNIEANSTIFKVTMRFTSDSNTIIQNAGYFISQRAISIDVNGQPGTGVIISSTNLPIPGSHIIPKKVNKEVPKKTNVWKLETLTLFFNEPDAQSDQLCGGKGSSLAFLTQLANNEVGQNVAFIVPQGFTLTTDAFDHQLKHNPRMKDAISNIENIAYRRNNGSLDEACKELSKLFIETSIEDKILDKIIKAFTMLTNNTGSSLKVAVRSSAIGEDGMESSSAGQNETFLGVQGIDEVLMAVRKCWASLFTAQSVTYRLQNLQPINTKMAVVIQKMVAPDCAGVLFTQHPVTRDPSKLLVTANYGLGESVVSGTVDPDTFIVQRFYKNNNLKILERNLGEKDSFISMTQTAGVNSSKISSKLRNEFCVNDQNLLKLCEIGIYLEERYASPRDIEWAVHKGTLYLLQSRPMTSTKSYTSWEIMHEFDTAVMSDEDYFSFGNVGEVMPEAMTPLSMSVVVPAFENGLMNYSPIKVVKQKYANSVFGIAYGRIAMNIFNAVLKAVKEEITIQNRLHELSIFGHNFITDEIHQIAVQRNGTLSKLTEFGLIAHMVKYGWKTQSIIQELLQFMEKFIGTYNRRNLRLFQSLNDLYDDVTQKIGESFAYVQGVHGLSTMMCSMNQTILFTSLAEGRKEMTPEFLADVTTLLSSCKNAESAEIPVALEEIATALLRCKCSKAQEFCDISADKGIAWLTENCITTYALFESFIEKHAHRGFQEFDLGYETWGMNPSLVIEMLQKTIRNRKVSDLNKKRAPKRSNEELLAELKTPTKSSTKRAIKFFLPRSQSYVELRERTKSQLVAYIHELRKAYCYLAEKMQKAGLLPDMGLIFYLTHQEIGTILKDRSRNDLISKATRRRRVLPELKKLQFDEFQWGLIKPRNTDAESLGLKNLCKVTGTPVCEGKITGRACVVKSFDEVAKIKAGDILITHSTDIAWSPYFPILSGVVTELGGLISHGAVVAREYGLPCIIGATNATAIITDGEDICMDGSAGIIIKLGNNNDIIT